MAVFLYKVVALQNGQQASYLLNKICFKCFTHLPEHIKIKYIISADTLLLYDLNINDEGAYLHGDQSDVQGIPILFC